MALGQKTLIVEQYISVSCVLAVLLAGKPISYLGLGLVLE